MYLAHFAQIVSLLLLSCWLKVLLFQSSPFTPRSDVLESQKDYLYDSFISEAGKFRRKELTVIVGASRDVLGVV